MTVVTCPDYDCIHNGFGECNLGIVAKIIDTGVVSQTHCPYYDDGTGRYGDDGGEGDGGVPDREGGYAESEGSFRG